MKNTINQPAVTDINRALHPTTAEDILPKCTWNILQDRPHVRYKTSLNIFKMIEIIQCFPNTME